MLICSSCGEKYVEGSICSCQRDAVLEEQKKNEVCYVNHEPLEREEGRGVHPVVAGILRKRGIEGDLDCFLRAPIEGLLEEKLKNQEEAAERIAEALQKGEKITLYGDYDADGVTSVALGLNILRRLGASADWYINDRFGEGFGIGIEGVEEIASRGTGLIITADNGISGQEAVERARRLGMDVVVTDHHEPTGPLPECIVVDPKQPGCTYPNRDLVGAGVLFKVLREVCLQKGLEKLPLKELDLVALGTVADVAPLQGENRVIVKNGLKLMNWDKCREGIRALQEVAGIRQVKSYHLGFIFGPMINAEGRLEGSPGVAVGLLTTGDREKAVEAAEKLKEANRKRQDLLEEQLELAEGLVEPYKDVFFIADSRFHEGIVGLIAGRLKENYNRPAIVLGKDGKNRYKGSGRSVPGLNLKEILDKMAGLMEVYGGHAMACGLTVAEDNLVVLKNMVETEVKKRLEGTGREKTVPVDGELSWDEVDLELARALEEMEPFGQGFPRPRFLLEDFSPDNVNYSRNGKHTRLEKENISCWKFGQRIESAGPFRLVGFPDVNDFRGKSTVQFRIEDWQEVKND